MALRKKILPNTIPIEPPSADEIERRMENIKNIKRGYKPKKKIKPPAGSPEHYPGGPGSFYGTEDIRII